MVNSLRQEFEYFKNNQKELVQNYEGRFLVIKNQEVKGDYSSIEEAYKDAISKFEAGTFIIQECRPGEEIYTATYHSIVI